MAIIIPNFPLLKTLTKTVKLHENLRQLKCHYLITETKSSRNNEMKGARRN